MSLKELQTSAVRVLHLVEPTERNVADVGQRLSLHPHDLTALLSSQARPLLRPYRNYFFAALPWPVYDRVNKEFTMTDIDFILADQQLVISDRANLTPINDLVHALESQATLRQDDAVTVLSQCLLRLARWTEEQSRDFHQEVRTTVDDRDAKEYADRLNTLAISFQELLEAIAARMNVTPEAVTMIKLAAHRLNHIVTRLNDEPRPVARQPLTPTFVQALPKMVRGYAWASAAVVGLIVYFISHH